MVVREAELQLRDNGTTELVFNREAECPGDTMCSPKRVDWVMRSAFALHKKAEEYVYLIVGNARSKPIAFFELSHGSAKACMIGIREVMLRTLLAGGSTIILVHNHPSGNLEPSEEDLAVTKRIEDACNLMDIILLDHVIIAGDSYVSLKEKELMEENN